MSISTGPHFGQYHPDYLRHRYPTIQVVETSTDPCTMGTKVAYKTRDGRTQVSPPFYDIKALDRFMEAIIALEK